MKHFDSLQVDLAGLPRRSVIKQHGVANCFGIACTRQGGSWDAAGHNHNLVDRISYVCTPALTLGTTPGLTPSSPSRVKSHGLLRHVRMCVHVWISRRALVGESSGVSNDSRRKVVSRVN